MTKLVFRISTLLLALAASQTLLHAQRPHSIEGTWEVNVTVVDCQRGTPIRIVRSLQLWSRDHSFSETANTYLRGSSVGAWAHDDRDTYIPTYWFFRYNADGTFKSMAEGLNKVTLSDDGKTFTATGTITDTDINGNVLSVGCVSQAASRLSDSDGD